MIWTKHKRGVMNRWILQDYPFFKVEFDGVDYGFQTVRVKFDMVKFDSPEKAQNFQMKEIYKVLHKLNLDKINTLDEFNKIPFIWVSFNDWCDNHGYGKYHSCINPNEYLKYIWINGRYSPSSPISNRYAIRYDASVGEHKAKKHAVKIIKRHIHRFLREYK